MLVYERNVTGTDPALRFAISPWPVVQIFGLELGAACLGALVTGVGIGLAAVARARSGGGAALWALGAAAAALLPVCALGLAALQELLPFAAGPGFFALLAGASLAAFALAASLGLRRRLRAHRARAALVWSVGGVLVLRADRPRPGARAHRLHHDPRRPRPGDHRRPGPLSRARGRVSGRARRSSSRPATSRTIPVPRIGFRLLTDQEFVYQNFGESYLLEFSAPRWIQCAYNPPYLEDEAERGAGRDGETSATGEWSCPSKPPELW